MPDRRVLVAGGALAAGAAAVGGHLVVGRAGPGYAGSLLVLDHLFDLAAVAALFLLCTALGLRATRRLTLPRPRPLETLVISAAVGGGLVAVAVLAAGLAGLLRPVPLSVLFGLLSLPAVATAPELVRLLRRLPEALLGAEDPAPTARAASLAILALLFLAMLVLALAPVTDWDSLTYHVNEPVLFLEAGRIHLAEDSLHGAFVGLAHLLYIPLLAVGSTTGPALLSLCTAGLLALAVLAAGDRFLDRRDAAVAALVVWGSPILVLVAVTPRVDVTLALYVFLAHYCLLVALIPGRYVGTPASAGGGAAGTSAATAGSGGPPTRDASDPGARAAGIAGASRPEASRRRIYLLAGALLGMAFGVKLQAAPYAVALLPLAVWGARAGGRRHAAGHLGALAAAGLVLALPWAALGWVLVGDPLYPLLSADTLEPWLAALAGAPGLPPTFDAGVLDWIWTVREPFNLRDYFVDPASLTVEGEASLYLANPLLALLPLALLWWRDRVLAWLAVPALLAALLIVVPLPRTNLRYLVPALVPLTMVAAVVAARALRKALPHGPATALLALLVVLALAPTGRAVADRIAAAPFLPHAVGAVSRAGFLGGHRDPAVRALALVAGDLEQRLDPGDRVLLLWEARESWLSARAIRDSRGTNWPILAAFREGEPGGGDCLVDAGFTHILLNAGAVRYWLARGLDPETAAYPAFEIFARRCLRPVYERAGFVLFRLEGGTADRSDPDPGSG